MDNNIRLSRLGREVFWFSVSYRERNRHQMRTRRYEDPSQWRQTEGLPRQQLGSSVMAFGLLEKMDPINTATTMKGLAKI